MLWKYLEEDKNAIIMKFVLFFCIVLASSMSEKCIQRRNSIGYKIIGENRVNGISEREVRSALIAAFNVWEHTIADLMFVTEPIYTDDYELVIEFYSFSNTSDSKTLEGDVSVTSNNCTTVPYDDVLVTKTIHNSTIAFNTDYSFKYALDNTSGPQNGIDLYLAAIREIGHAFGLEYNNNPASVMFKRLDNFSAFKFNNTELPSVDLNAVGKLYVLKNRPLGYQFNLSKMKEQN